MPPRAQLRAHSCSRDFLIFPLFHIAVSLDRNLNSEINI